ncbi:glycosylphosphatidylinositol anchor attachment 1 protein-like [Dendronephthya gigantea]|uniref:glycosylphosphatidylinositol anchor attachment 1 protein-like n=1 Tax=Dendronephthya gigantea TaxID=151771 RepID=UPI0010698C6C|nr:glycosylphosphatidylinositol anchor attachment 1 protein-like [Dendronephthya gigantea]
MATKLRRLLNLVLRHHVKIGFLGYISGVIWFVALLHPSFISRTYFSENALLPAMVDTQYRYGREAKSLKAEVENPSEMYRDNFPLWLMNKMTAIGLEAYQQNFTVHFPKELSILNDPINGTNVYGILRAPRTARTEALVFLVPFKTRKTGPFYELVFLLSLAEHFRHNIYWSKDIVFLVVDQNEIGVQSWLDEYHGIQSKYVKSSRMLGRAGEIQAAISLELEDRDISHMQVMIESLNGQLPNLDLVNMVIRLCRSEGISVALKKLPVRFFNDGFDEYRSSLSTMVSMMFGQASGRPSANHGLFPKYGIEAVTLLGKKAVGEAPVGFARVGRALEGMFRSLNNLLERFHQSFFFYLLPSTSHYVSIGLYMPPLGCLMIGPILAAMACWIASALEKDEIMDNVEEELENKQEKNGDKNEDGKTQEDESSGKTDELPKKDPIDNDEEFAFTQIPRHFGKVLRVILAGHLVGLLVYLSPYMLRFKHVFKVKWDPSNFTIFVLFGAFLLGSNRGFIMRITNNMEKRDVILLKSIALVIYVCQVGCLATVNFSFGFFLAIFTVPAFLLVQSTKNRFRRQLQILLVFLASPPCILFLLIVVYSFFTTETKHISELMRNSKTLFRDSILSSLRDLALLGTWSYPVVTLVILPNWLLFWSVANT